MTRKLSDWNIFVKKIYTEGKAKDSNYEFKQALEDASKRKSEMKHSSMSSKTAKKNRRSISSRRSRSRSASMAGGKKSKSKSKSRKHHRHRKH